MRPFLLFFTAFLGNVAFPLFAATNDFKLFVSVAPDVRSAYLSRAKVVEDRPTQCTFSRIGLDGGAWGKIGAWNAAVSSLTDRRDRAYRRMWHEIDWAVFYHYDLVFSDEWKLANEIWKSWNTYDGYTPVTHSQSEWRLFESLENPYVVPYMQQRSSVHPRRWNYWQAGLRRRFALPCDFAVQPRFYAELGDENLFVNRYGKKLAGYSYDNGLAALDAAVEVTWKWTKWCSFFVEVGQFDLVSDEARARTKALKGNPSLRRDLTWYAIGVRCKF